MQRRQDPKVRGRVPVPSQAAGSEPDPAPATENPGAAAGYAASAFDDITCVDDLLRAIDPNRGDGAEPPSPADSPEGGR